MSTLNRLSNLPSAGREFKKQALVLHDELGLNGTRNQKELEHVIRRACTHADVELPREKVRAIIQVLLSN